MNRVNRNIVMVLKVLAGVIGFTLVWLILRGDAWSQELEKYVPINAGFCGDVQLNCIKAIPKETEIFYIIFDKGKIIAITKVSGDKEEIVWGRLPLKPNEKDL